MNVFGDTYTAGLYVHTLWRYMGVYHSINGTTSPCEYTRWRGRTNGGGEENISSLQYYDDCYVSFCIRRTPTNIMIIIYRWIQLLLLWAASAAPSWQTFAPQLSAFNHSTTNLFFFLLLTWFSGKVALSRRGVEIKHTTCTYYIRNQKSR